MSKSSLAEVTYLAHTSNYTKGRSGRKIEGVCLHHCAGVITAKNLGSLWQNANRNGSSHYGIGSDNIIANYVSEDDTAWTNSNWDSNCKTVTIECSNSGSKPNWPISDKNLELCIQLIVDIFKRNNIKQAIDKKTIFKHKYFISTDCPGAYLDSKWSYIINEINKRLSSHITPTTPTSKYPYNITLKKGTVLRDSNSKAYQNATAKDRTVSITGESGNMYKIYSTAFNPATVYVNKIDIDGKKYPYNGIIKKGSSLYDINGKKYGGNVAIDRTVSILGEVNNKFKISNVNFKPSIVYCDKGSIK